MGLLGKEQLAPSQRRTSSKPWNASGEGKLQHKLPASGTPSENKCLNESSLRSMGVLFPFQIVIECKRAGNVHIPPQYREDSSPPAPNYSQFNQPVTSHLSMDKSLIAFQLKKISHQDHTAGYSQSSKQNLVANPN